MIPYRPLFHFTQSVQITEHSLTMAALIDKT